MSPHGIVRTSLRVSIAALWLCAIAGCDEVYGVGELRGASTTGSAVVDADRGGRSSAGSSAIAGAKASGISTGGLGAGTAVGSTSAGGHGGTVGAAGATVGGGDAGSTVGLAGGTVGTVGLAGGTVGLAGGTGGTVGLAGGTVGIVGSSGTLGLAGGTGGTVGSGGTLGLTGGTVGAGGVGAVTTGGTGGAFSSGHGGAAGVAGSVRITGGTGNSGTGTARDEFGIQMLYPSLAVGKQWQSRWDTPARSFTDRDPDDEWVEARQGNGSYAVDGAGTLKITGVWPRFDVRDPMLKSQWRDVEITIYFQRIADDNPDWGGLISMARTNHGIVGALTESQNLCDARGIGVRLRYDGRVEFVKETSHFVLGTSEYADFATIGQQPGWDGGLPYDKWIGYKHVVYDRADGAVKQELWIDEGGGANGGTWVKRDEYVDAGGEFGKGGSPCASGIDPSIPLTNSPTRVGSETGLPNITVYFQSQSVGTDGLEYKWGSVREIAAPASNQ